MSKGKLRVTVTVDPSLAEAGVRAVKAGRAASLSAWVNDALAEHAAKERRRQALAELIAEYEAEHGVITQAEMEAQIRADRANAVIVRGPRRRRRSA
jgi:hypothetical protein